jgi:hypothetical protein
VARSGRPKRVYQGYKGFMILSWHLRPLQCTNIALLCLSRIFYATSLYLVGFMVRLCVHQRMQGGFLVVHLNVQPQDRWLAVPSCYEGATPFN